MDEKIFERVEKKYLIDAAQKAEILRAVERKMKPTNYHKSKVMNIYFDTDNYDFIIKSIEKPEFKQKLRARSYGGFNKVFLEIKTKMRGKDYNVGYKRRVLITRKDFDKLIKREASVVKLAEQKIEKADDVQIAKEVDYMINLFDLSPKILVYYDRTSYSGENNLRLTFDENLKYRDKNLKFTRNAKDKHYFFDEKNIIMEIKANGVMPLWLVKTLSKAKAYPTSFSKIGKIYGRIRKEKNV